jgi:N-ethylmaleimide reductase
MFLAHHYVPLALIAVASMSLANPDLIERIKTNAPLNAADPSTFFSGGAKGYTDYPPSR